LWGSHPEQIEVFPDKYRFSLCNLLHVAAKNGIYVLFPENLKKLKELRTDTKDAALEGFSVYYFYKLVYSLNCSDFAQALEDVKEIEVWMLDNEGKVNDGMRLGIQVNIGLTYMLVGDYATSRLWIDKVVGHAQSEHRMDLQALARILEVVIIFELGEISWCLSRVKASQMWLRRYELLFEFEAEVLRAFRTMCNHAEKYWNQDLRQLLSNLLSLSEKGKESNGLQELILWAKAKLVDAPVSVFLEKGLGKG
jgi:hypothetical protein